MQQILGSKPYYGQKVWMVRQNMIIPQLVRAEQEVPDVAIIFEPPSTCPYCNAPTKIVDEGPRVVLSSGRSLPKWYSDSFNTKISTEERRRLRSKTFPGFAQAVAEQWGKIL